MVASPVCQTAHSDSRFLVLLDAASFSNPQLFAVCHSSSPGSPVSNTSFLYMPCCLPALSPLSFPPPSSTQKTLLLQQLDLGLFPAFFAVSPPGSAGISNPPLNSSLRFSLS